MRKDPARGEVSAYRGCVRVILMSGYIEVTDNRILQIRSSLYCLLPWYVHILVLNW